MRLAAFQAIIYQVTATVNSPIAFLDCVFIFYTARIKQTSLRADLLTHWTASHNNMEEKPEDNRRIRNNGTLRAGSNQIQAADGKQKYFQWPNQCCPIVIKEKF